MSALISGMAGIMVASYGNEGTVPTSLLIYRWQWRTNPELLKELRRVSTKLVD
jgi:hypothetical protein